MPRRRRIYVLSLLLFDAHCQPEIPQLAIHLVSRYAFMLTRFYEILHYFQPRDEFMLLAKPIWSFARVLKTTLFGHLFPME